MTQHSGLKHYFQKSLRAFVYTKLEVRRLHLELRWTNLELGSTKLELRRSNLELGGANLELRYHEPKA